MTKRQRNIGTRGLVIITAVLLASGTAALARDIPRPVPKPVSRLHIDLRNVPLPHPNPSPRNRMLSAEDAQTYRHLLVRASQMSVTEIDLNAATISNKELMPVLHWLSLRSLRNADEIPAATAFLDTYAHYPQVNQIIARVERVIDEAGDQEQAAWFTAHPPITPTGHISFGKLLVRQGKYSAGIDNIRHGWRDGVFRAKTEAEILNDFGDAITARDHAYRLDRLLWNGQTASAQRQISRTDKSLHAVARARLALRQSHAGVDARVGAVPSKQQADTGLIYERARWRRRKGFDDGAADLLLAGGFDAADTFRPDKIWQERHLLARHYIREHDYVRAYGLVRKHGLKEGGDFAQAEWLAGWLSLRFLNEPKRAITHFERLHEGVSMPISKARAAYWAGRAWQARSGKSAQRKAMDWFQQAAIFNWTYYGGLARAELGTGGSGVARPADERALSAKFLASPMVKTIRHLDGLGEAMLARRFFHALLDQADAPRHFVALASLGSFLNRTDLALDTAKRASYRSIMLAGPAFPVIPLPGLDELANMTNYIPEPALITAIQRQESGFRIDAVSHAGARGLMQLMPATARKVAGNLNLNYQPSALVHNPTYNAMLGSAYLGEMIERFDGSYPLAIASYNAGPHRVDRWLKEYGDPRRADVDMIDWIESIPFSETRNYVQRVLEAVPIYRERLDADGTHTATLHDILHIGHSKSARASAPITPAQNPRRNH